MNLIINDQARALLEERHIYEDDIKAVISAAEESGEKLYQADSNHLLAKQRISNATFYVEYTPVVEGGYEVHTAYSHRSEIEEV